jgi:hypothetical protein
MGAPARPVSGSREEHSYAKYCRSYWIPGSYAPLVSEKCNSFLRFLKKKAFKKERRTKNGVYAIGECTTLESNKSHY